MPSNPSTIPPHHNPSGHGVGTVAVASHSEPVRPLSWGAVIAGAVAALAAHLLITLFTAGLGIQAFDPMTVTEPAQKISIGLGVVWSISALLALWLGGWVAGRLTPDPSRGLGGLHGFLVWSVATIVMAFAVTSGVGKAASTAANLTGKTVSAATQAAAPAADNAGDALAQFVGSQGNILQSFVQELAPEGQSLNPRAARDVSASVVRYFSQDEAQRQGEARQALVSTIAQHSQLDEAQASQRVNEWTAAYDRAQENVKAMAARAETEAREAATAASNYVTHAAVWTVVAFIVGALSAMWGGTKGARSRRDHDEGTPHATHGLGVGTPHHA